MKTNLSATKSLQADFNFEELFSRYIRNYEHIQKNKFPPSLAATILNTREKFSLFAMGMAKAFQSSHINCKKQKKVMLLLDGQTLQSKSLDAVVYARENGIILLQLPGQTTDRLQPLDEAIFVPLQTYFIQAQKTFLRQYEGEKILQELLL